MSKEKTEFISNENKKSDEVQMTIFGEDEKWIYAEISKNDFRAGKAPLGSILVGEEKNTFKIEFPKNQKS